MTVTNIKSRQPLSTASAAGHVNHTPQEQEALAMRVYDSLIRDNGQYSDQSCADEAAYVLSKLCKRGFRESAQRIQRILAERTAKGKVVGA